MKLRNILSTALAVVTVLAASSCKDMLRVDSKIVMYDYQNTLDQPTDTVYSVMGIIKKLQKVADRVVVLGEIRGDLVSTTDHVSDDIAELYDYNLPALKSTNKYNNPVDFYAIINNCNYFLATADTVYQRNKKNVFTKEYITVLCYRAWTYLQMAQIYGKVYFVTEPILSGDQTEGWDFLDIKEIAAELLNDFEDRFMDYDVPQYGSLSGGGESHSSADLFIPVRIIMGDLALWSEQYAKAALYYHDYLSHNKTAIPTETACITWFGNDWIYLDEDTYANTLGKNGKPICYIPMEVDEYHGTMSDLPNIFTSTKENDYWYQLTRSQALTSLSARQNYCYHDFNAKTGYEEPIFMEDKMGQENVLLRGDLRLQSILSIDKNEDVEDDVFSSSTLNTYSQKLNKINPEKICLYRKDVVYLRLAEAMNRAGLPQTAFAVLKYGLCKEVIDSISQVEKDRAAGMGIEDVYVFNENRFRQVQYTYTNKTKTIDNLPVTKQTTILQNTTTYNTMGIHSRGCGDAAMDSTYVIPYFADLKDSIRYVEERIIDEMALETCFEGYRFGDLMRVSMHRAADSGYDFADNDFLARKVAARATATMNNPDSLDAKGQILYDRLRGDDPGALNWNWFLNLTGK
jgi:hypothetical protein